MTRGVNCLRPQFERASVNNKLTVWLAFAVAYVAPYTSHSQRNCGVLKYDGPKFLMERLHRDNQGTFDEHHDNLCEPLYIFMQGD
jgi:hypothetical protein